LSIVEWKNRIGQSTFDIRHSTFVGTLARRLRSGFGWRRVL
jgi:hypothetical protein